MTSAVQLQLGLFGALTVSLGLPDDPSPRAVTMGSRAGGLLALLSLAQGRFFSRVELARELWSGAAEGGSAASFNTVLWRLRKALEGPPLAPGDVIECDRQGALRIASSVQVDNDVERYRREIEPPMAKSVEALDGQDMQALRRAVAMYRGDVLASFHDDWALRLRERHRRLQLGALSRLMHVSSLQQDWADAVAQGEAMLEIDELREDVHRELMRCHLAMGQRALALRQFERCRSALRRELAIQPMRETLELHQRIAAAAVAMPAPAGDPQAEPVPPRPAGPIEQARWHLAQADEQLRQALRR